MEEIRLIDVKEEILAENRDLAEQTRQRLTTAGAFLLNVMGSPGSGKTSLIVQTIAELRGRYRIAVIETDIDSLVDSERVAEEGVRVVQIRTGGSCHADAAMVDRALDELPLEELDLILLENVGNLVCPAETDTGAVGSAVILSIPEGDDKPLKYPLVFTVCDAMVINKVDYLELTDFDLERARERAAALNDRIALFAVSCKTAHGIEAWTNWLADQVLRFKTRQT